jgi:hypothetical protein
MYRSEDIRKQPGPKPNAYPGPQRRSTNMRRQPYHRDLIIPTDDHSRRDKLRLAIFYFISGMIVGGLIMFVLSQ